MSHPSERSTGRVSASEFRLPFSSGGGSGGGSAGAPPQRNRPAAASHTHLESSSAGGDSPVAESSFRRRHASASTSESGSGGSAGAPPRHTNRPPTFATSTSEFDSGRAGGGRASSRRHHHSPPRVEEVSDAEAQLIEEKLIIDAKLAKIKLNKTIQCDSGCESLWPADQGRYEGQTRMMSSDSGRIAHTAHTGRTAHTAHTAHSGHSEGSSRFVAVSGGRQGRKPAVHFPEAGRECSKIVPVSNRRVGDDPHAALEATRKAKQNIQNGLTSLKTRLVYCESLDDWRGFRTRIGHGAFTSLLDILEPLQDRTRRHGNPSPAFMHSAMTAWEIAQENHVVAVVLFKTKIGKPLSTLDPAIHEKAAEYYDHEDFVRDFQEYLNAMLELWSEKFATEEARDKANLEDAFNACFASPHEKRHYWFPWWRLATERTYLLKFLDIMCEN